MHVIIKHFNGKTHKKHKILFFYKDLKSYWNAFICPIDLIEKKKKHFCTDTCVCVCKCVVCMFMKKKTKLIEMLYQNIYL